jgi:hypothetical protein
MSLASKGFCYLRSALTASLGAFTVLGGAYIISRMQEKQEVDARLDRLERLVEKLKEPQETSAEEPRGRRRRSPDTEP